MIKALYNLGKVYTKKNGTGYEYENPNPKNYYKNIIKINFSFNGNEVIYNGLELEEFSISKLNLYLYSKGTSRGGDNTPTTIVSKADNPLEKLLNPIKKVEIESFKKTFEFLSNKDNYEVINNDILNMMLPKEGYILTLVLNQKWVGEYEEIVTKLFSTNNESFYFMKSIGTSKSNNKICYCCNQEKEEIYGFVNTYNFYTVDKKGFVSGGFDQEKSWKNYPICKNCSEVLEKGKKYVEDKFLDKFPGFNYMIIPKTIFNNEKEEYIEYFQNLLESFEEKNRISLSKERRKELFYNEEISLDAMSELENNMMFNIMFYEKSNNAFKILLNIEDVLPSRLKTIFETKEKIEIKDVYLHLKSKNEFKDLKFNFGIFREFFSSDKNFLEIINSVFVGKQISYDFMLESFVRNLTEKMNKEESVYFNTRNSLLILEVLDRLSLLKNKKKGEVKEMIEKNEKNQIFLDFLENHKETFDSDIKRAIFLEGVLTQNLLTIQYIEKKSTPFYSRLNSLKMNEKIIKRIFFELMDKLTEYKKKHYYLELEKMIASYFASSNFKDLSNDEMSYYFVLGMNLVDKFKTKEEDVKEEA